MIIDVHGHLGNINLAPFWRADWQKLEEHLDKSGIDILCASSAQSIMYDAIQGDKELDAALKSSKKILGYATVNPMFPESVDNLKYLHKNRKFIGVKVHPDYHGYEMRSKNARSFLDNIARKVKLMLFHVSCMPGTGFADVEVVARFADEHPETNFILAHLGGIFQNNIYPYFPNTRGLEIIAGLKAKNIYVDTAHYLMYAYPGVMEKMVELIGSDHIVFGTDCPLQSYLQMKFAKETIENLDISKTEKEKIFWRNAESLTGSRERLK